MKIQKKRLSLYLPHLSLFLLFLVFVGFVAFGVMLFYRAQRASDTENQPEYVFTYADNQPEDYPTVVSGKYFAQLVYERTDGRIKINVYSDGQMGTEPEVLEQLEYGGIDFARVSIMPMADSISALNVLQLPYLYDDEEHMWRVLDSKIGTYFLGSLEEKGMIGLSWYSAGARNFYNDVRPIKKLEDMEGLRIRVAESQMMAELVSLLGAVPQQLAYSEVFSYMETDSIDGAENNFSSYESMKHYEVAPYITVDEHSRIPEVQVCSSSTWSKLDEEDRNIILECARESAVMERTLWSEREEEVLARLKEGHCRITYISSSELKRFREATEPLYEMYAKEYSELIEAIKALK